MGVPWSTYLHWLRAGWRYYWRARTRYDVHSPFLARLTEEVLENRDVYYVFGDAITLRAYWEQRSLPLTFPDDPGAGSRAGQGLQRSTRDLVRHSAVGESTGRQLFHLARIMRPWTILELGTNLGFSSLYLRAGAPAARMITLEGHAEVAALARQTWQMGKVTPPEQRIGRFAHLLGPVLQELKQVDLVFLDGDHRGEAVLSYAAAIWPHLHHDSVLIISDIYWSDDMTQAWEALKKWPRVRLSVDWLHLGLLFFRKEIREPLHVTQVPAAWKPWHWGLWGKLS
jgi:predicted O-methyltransferase YrrM